MIVAESGWLNDEIINVAKSLLKNQYKMKGFQNTALGCKLSFDIVVHTELIQILFNVYCPECPPGGTIGHPGGQQIKFLPFGHGMDLAAFNGTDLQNKSFRDWAEISKA